MIRVCGACTEFILSEEIFQFLNFVFSGRAFLEKRKGPTFA